MTSSIIGMETQHWFLGIVGLGTQQSIVITPGNFYTKLGLSEQPRLEIHCSCSNAYGVVTKVVSLFELQRAESAAFVNVREQFDWVKLKEAMQ